MINTINGIDLLFLFVGLFIGAKFGVMIQKSIENEKKLKHENDFIEFLKGHSIESQMEKDGWKI